MALKQVTVIDPDGYPRQFTSKYEAMDLVMNLVIAYPTITFETDIRAEDYIIRTKLPKPQ